MTQITSTNTTTNQSHSASSFANQAKDLLVRAKGATYAGAVNTAQFCKNTAVYLGTGAVYVIKNSPELTYKAAASAKEGVQNYYSSRTASEIALDVTAVAGGAFALYGVASYGPSQLASDVKDFLATPVTQKNLLEGIKAQNKVLIDAAYVTTIATGLCAFVALKVLIFGR